MRGEVRGVIQPQAFFFTLESDETPEIEIAAKTCKLGQAEAACSHAIAARERADGAGNNRRAIPRFTRIFKIIFTARGAHALRPVVRRGRYSRARSRPGKWV